MTDGVALQVIDAVPLAHVLAIDVARRAGVRALVVKGPSASLHGLRPERLSADADVLISPDGFEKYLAALGRSGWYERPTAEGPGPKALHSVTSIHDGWPCDIDAHVHFPGFLAPAQAVFDELWSRREPLMLAGVELDTVDRAGAFLVAALHALRTPAQTARHEREMRGLVGRVIPSIDAAARADVVALAIATGAIDTARPVLARLDLPLPEPTPHGRDAALDAWRARVGARGETLAQWFPIVSRARWRDRPALVARMIWPTDASFRMSHPETPPGRLAADRGRWARVGRGLRAAPRVLRGRALAKRGVTDDSLLHGVPR
ncbi:nucleotidyltransferase family protein [Demequina maris]|uniref:nucleotidyltransferase family protein n=1 Tax=Demequina maris TaxID=1638982 RepID=UPI000781C5CD|nr:nucleotidyltransferase family protein [Demequina maris]